MTHDSLLGNFFFLLCYGTGINGKTVLLTELLTTNMILWKTKTKSKLLIFTNYLWILVVGLIVKTSLFGSLVKLYFVKSCGEQIKYAFRPSYGPVWWQQRHQHQLKTVLPLRHYITKTFGYHKNKHGNNQLAQNSLVNFQSDFNLCHFVMETVCLFWKDQCGQERGSVSPIWSW